MNFRAAWIKPIIVAFFIPTGVFSQLNNTFFKDSSDYIYFQKMPVNKERINWTLRALHYNKNNEYFNKINPGQTYFGTQIQPGILIKPNSKLLLEAGLFIDKQYGDPRFITQVLPIIKFTFIHHDLMLRLGSLQSHVQHRLPDPILNYENVFNDPVEYGIQTVMTKNKLRYESYTQWKQNVDKKTARQEIIIVGQNLEWYAIKRKNFKLCIPVQGYGYHKGGQAIPGAPPLTNLFVLGSGSQLLLFQKIQLESMYIGSLDKSSNMQQPYRNGFGWMNNIRWFFRKHEFAFTWWYSREFVSVLGAPMFSNVNFEQTFTSSNTRKLAMLRWNYTNYLIKDMVWLDARFEPYYDLNAKKLEFAHTFHVRWILDNVK